VITCRRIKLAHLSGEVATAYAASEEWQTARKGRSTRRKTCPSSALSSTGLKTKRPYTQPSYRWGENWRQNCDGLDSSCFCLPDDILPLRFILQTFHTKIW
jgi:hypothetical protein